MIGDLGRKRFAEVLKRLHPAYRRIFLVYLAYRHKDEWKLVYALAVLQSDRPDNTPPINIVTDSVFAGQRLLDLAKPESQKTLRDLAEGKLTVDEVALSLSEVVLNPISFNFFANHPPALPNFNTRTPFFMVTSNSPANFFQELDLSDVDNQLRTAATPYDGLEDLFQVLGIPADVRSTNMRRVEIALGLALVVAFPDSKIAESKAFIKLLASPNIDTNLVQIGLRVPQTNAPFRRFTADGRHIAWSDSAPWHVGALSVPVGNAIYAQCFVQYNGEHVSRWWLTDASRQANFRTALQRHFDPDDRKLRKLIFPAKTEARDLEKGLMLLLSIHGFSVLPYGEKDTVQDGPDLIAIAPSRRILVVECAVDLPDAQWKIGKLQSRTKRIVETLRGANINPVDVVSVMATPVPQSELSSHSDMFAKAAVALVAREQLEDLLQRMGIPENPESIYDEAKRLIPKTT